MRKKLLTISALLLFLSSAIFSQDRERPYLVTIYNMISMTDMAKVNKIIDSISVPILQQLVDEKMLYSFGQFTHAWGDEWNMNFWYVAKDLASFEKFWSEYRKRISDKYPKAWAELTGYIKKHKDNIYRIRGQYPPPSSN